MITQETLTTWMEKQQSAHVEHDNKDLCEACAFRERIKDTEELELLASNLMAGILQTMDPCAIMKDAVITGMWIGYQMAQDEQFIKEMERLTL